MLDVTTDQRALIEADVTRPIFLIELGFDGDEYLSTNGAHTVGDTTYAPADATVSSAQNWARATVSLRPTPERVAAAVSRNWRGQACRISLLPARKWPQIYEDGTFEEGLALEGLVTEDPLLLIDGTISAARADRQSVVVELVHRSKVGLWSPRTRLSAPVCNHLPPPGKRFLWEGDFYTLEAAR